MTYIPGNGGAGGNIATAGDVALSNPVNNDVLTFDQSIGKWKNAPAAAGAVADGSITNVKIAANATINADKLADGTNNKIMTAAERTKLTGVAAGATANSTDAYLLNRVNHTGVREFAKIVHGADASMARPNAVYVLWEGSVEPTNWINGDDWNQTT